MGMFLLGVAAGVVVGLVVGVILSASVLIWLLRDFSVWPG